MPKIRERIKSRFRSGRLISVAASSLFAKEPTRRESLSSDRDLNLRRAVRRPIRHQPRTVFDVVRLSVAESARQIFGALLVAAIIPLSILFAGILMRFFNGSGNLMSLGVLDFGLIVDGAVVMVQNVVRRRSEAQAERVLMEFPEVKRVVTKVGCAEVAADPMSVEAGDIFIEFPDGLVHIS